MQHLPATHGIQSHIQTQTIGHVWSSGSENTSRPTLLRTACLSDRSSGPRPTERTARVVGHRPDRIAQELITDTSYHFITGIRKFRANNALRFGPILKIEPIAVSHAVRLGDTRLHKCLKRSLQVRRLSRATE